MASRGARSGGKPKGGKKDKSPKAPVGKKADKGGY